MCNITGTTVQITDIAGYTFTAKIELIICKYDGTNNIYPANGKFFKLQRSLFALMSILIFALCNQ